MPPFLVLYLWYDHNCGKVKETVDRFGSEFVGESHGYPYGGVWTYYTVWPNELISIQTKWGNYESTGCRGEDIVDVFTAYNRFAKLGLAQNVIDVV